MKSADNLFDKHRAHGQFRRGLQPPAFQVRQQLAPAPGAFAKAVDQAQHVLVAPFIWTDNHQHRLAIILAEIDPPDRFLHARIPSGA